ncbi:flavin reductase family protein [Streptomyces sp. CAI-21]|uniref:flavin reductase family protein n=1 Tax=Streptomyces TaxID=1883 RepID=UPI0004CBB621|nr:flavin reductase family protein [Streptomyces sampsonii]NUW09487.1 flavin reductase family protein [Streptomyces sp. CAI-21]NVI30962.1 flavin reductase family protein [Streptomyces sp. CAI-17]RZE80879.1 flavin reductase [Streptomyces albidoflavus]
MNNQPSDSRRSQGAPSSILPQKSRDSTQALRDVLGHFTTGVTVVTAMSSRGPIGMTVNSFSSVSLDPPLVLFSVSRRSQLCDHLTAAGSFAVNILSAEQRALSTQFAKPGLNRFGAAPWRAGTSGAPILSDVIAILECQVTDIHDGGDHMIIVGRVEESAYRADFVPPLIFYRGQYQEIYESA